MKKKLLIFLVIGLITIGLLFGILVLVLSLTWKPTILDKYSFSDSEKSIIASELNIPAHQISIDEMHYSHGKDSSFLIYVTASSLDVLSSYEYQGLQYYTNKPYYNNSDGIVCTVDSEDPYKLTFSINDWNKILYDLMK